MIASRRRFLFGAGALLAAPAIVRVASLMPVSVPDPEPEPDPFVSQSWDQGRITITCAPLRVGEVIRMQGFYSVGYNGAWRVTAVSGANHLVVPA